MPARGSRLSNQHGGRTSSLGSERPGRADLALILELARDADAARLRELMRNVDFERLAAELTRLRLLALLGTRLVARAPEGLTVSFRERVAQLLRASREEALYKQMLTWKLLQALERSGVPAMPLKGPFLSERLHGDAGLRLSHDIDLLVATHDLSRAIEILEDQGYAMPRRGKRLPRLHHILEAPGAPPIDLHWRITWYDTEYSEAMLSRSVLDGGIRRPAATDELASLLLWYARDGLVGLRYPVDVGAWWARYGDGSELESLVRIIDEHPALERPITAGALAVEQVTGPPIGSGLGLYTSVRPGTRAALALLDWAELRPEASDDAAVKIVDGLVTAPRDVGRWLRRSAFPRLPGRGLVRAFHQLGYLISFTRRSAPIYWRLVANRKQIAEGRAGGIDGARARASG